MSSDDQSLSPAVAAASGKALAPGFRFHPTDEELVSYYLKRKVFGRPFRVDAISEVELYKAEPWDLPGMSRIQSRDMEWYFFSPLDKKYASRSRTSRTTGQGYWKTTGKDRPIKRGPRTVGMKKTLVFHVGKAPRGDRTNWVMHEYRLEDEELVKAGVLQDAYVVCRIFQKTGAGPQNGAQYGAPFLEEEWEEDDMLLVPKEGGDNNPIVDFTDQQVMQSDDFEQKSEGMRIQNENAFPLLDSNDGQNACYSFVDNDGQNIFDRPLEPTSFLMQAHDNQDSINDIDPKAYMPENSQGLIDNGEINCEPEIHQNQEAPGDDYLELNDFANLLDVDNSSVQDPVVCHTGAFKDEVSGNMLGESSIPEELHVIEEFFDAADENADFSDPEQMLTADNDFCFELDEIYAVTRDSSSCKQADEGKVYFDAPSQNPAVEQGPFIEMNDFANPTMMEPIASDPMDELIAYFDATEDNLPYSCVDKLTSKEIGGEGLSSTEIPVGDQVTAKSNTPPVIPDVHSDSSWDKTLTNRLVGMLGSISSPPALAAEYPLKGTKSFVLSPAAQTSSSIHITTGVIQINGLAVSGNAKNGDMDLLSYGITRNDVGGDTQTFCTVGKMHGGAMCMLIRSGFCLSFLSVLFLAVSFKLGVYICAR